MMALGERTWHEPTLISASAKAANKHMQNNWKRARGAPLVQCNPCVASDCGASSLGRILPGIVKLRPIPPVERSFCASTRAGLTHARPFNTWLNLNETR
jgi:hypothetical protein